MRRLLFLAIIIGMSGLGNLKAVASEVVSVKKPVQIKKKAISKTKKNVKPALKNSKTKKIVKSTGGSKDLEKNVFGKVKKLIKAEDKKDFLKIRAGILSVDKKGVLGNSKAYIPLMHASCVGCDGYSASNFLKNAKKTTESKTIVDLSKKVAKISKSKTKGGELVKEIIKKRRELKVTNPSVWGVAKKTVKVEEDKKTIPAKKEEKAVEDVKIKKPIPTKNLKNKDAKVEKMLKEILVETVKSSRDASKIESINARLDSIDTRLDSIMTKGSFKGADAEEEGDPIEVE